VAEDGPFRRVDPSPGQQRSGSFGSRFGFNGRQAGDGDPVAGADPGCGTVHYDPSYAFASRTRFPLDDPDTSPGQTRVLGRARSVRGDALSIVRPQRAEAAGPVARLLAQLWRRVAGQHPAIVRRAFDLGITHFDLANNYGPPYGSAEANAGRILSEDFGQYRDELVISSKAGYDMWPGPYGDRGSRKYLLASLDQSLKRLGLEYVDIFYSHRLDSQTPLEETMGALDTAVRQGKALYAGISNYPPAETRQATTILRNLGTPLLIHQARYSMLDRWVEGGLLDALGEDGVGCIAFSPLAQGQLTNRYLNGVPAGSRATHSRFLTTDTIDENLPRIRALNAIATGRGQTLAQMALAWVLRDSRVTSAIIGASSVEQLEDNVQVLSRLDFEPRELAQIDRCLAGGQ
jgi:L-glyceraldehyde 3-phosphate reductase